MIPVANFDRALLRSPDVQKDPRRYLQAVQKVIACMTLGIDVSKLFSEMIMVRLYSIGLPCTIASRGWEGVHGRRHRSYQYALTSSIHSIVAKMQGITYHS